MVPRSSRRTEPPSAANDGTNGPPRVPVTGRDPVVPFVRVRAVRIFHSGVVAPWRQRDRELIRRGVHLTHVSPLRWNEGGELVELDAGDDAFVIAARTLGHHPYGFVYDPRPIWRILRSEPIDVLDVHEEPASLAVLEVLLLARLAGCRAPIVVYGAQNIEKRFPIPFRWIERWALRRAKGAYVCNAEAGEIYRRKGFRGVIRVIGLGVDIERFAPAAVSVPASPLRLGFVGRVDERKGLRVVVEALAHVDQGATLDVFGSGPEIDPLIRRAAELGVSERITFHGFVAHHELPERYRDLHVLVVPSQTTPSWVEQFGRIVVEAMASGVVVVASDSGSLPEVVGEAGVIVPEADASAWARAIERLAADSCERDRLVAAGLQRVAEYSWPAVASAHLDLYRAVTS